MNSSESGSNMEHFPIIERLHTDVLEEKYGPIMAKVIRHNDDIREVHLIDEAGISRTYAITFFEKGIMQPEITEINQEIKDGFPIGKAFRAHGYTIRKNVIDVFTLKIPKHLQNEFRVESEYAKARLSEFYAKKENSSPLVYGTVAEIYTPDFRGPIVTESDVAQINPSTAAFEQVGVSKDEIWEKLGTGNNWVDMNEKYEQAKENSLPLIKSFEGKINNYLSS